MSAGRVRIIVFCAGGRIHQLMDGDHYRWVARSAVHRELTAAVKAGRIVGPQLFLAYDHADKVAGAGHPLGQGWSSGWRA